MSNYTYIFFVCKRLHLIEICLCCFLDMHLCSNSLSILATISPLIMIELFPACFSCNNKFILSDKSLGSDGTNNVEIPEAKIAGGLSNLIRDSFL